MDPSSRRRGSTTARGALLLAFLALPPVGLMACGEASSGGPSARVTHVVDGDTVEMERLGTVRLIGVDAPEKRRCYDDAATRFTRARLEGEVVEYELGEQERDRYDRTLAYLSREGQMHNEALLSEGYAKVLTIPPNDKYAERFEQAEREASEADTGLWRTCDRQAIRARRAAARRRALAAKRRRLATAARRQARQERRAAEAEARRQRAAARRAQQEAEEQAAREEDSGGSSSGGSSSGGSGRYACGPGDRDGDGDGRCNE